MEQALSSGATDLLPAPFRRLELEARLQSILQLGFSRSALRLRQSRGAEKTRLEVSGWSDKFRRLIWRLAQLGEYRDDASDQHVMRIGLYSHLIAHRLAAPRPFVENLLLAAPLHDIGNIGIPDMILMKRGSLTGREIEIMRQHCAIGARILCGTENSSHVSQPAGVTPCTDLLEMSARIALSHHEKFDGSGYPQGLSGSEIPLEARIVAVADVYDSLTSARPYRAPYPEEVALDLIEADVGKHFDPAVYAAFADRLPQLRLVRLEFTDEGAEPDDASAVSVPSLAACS
jgi:putative two-component system response regulator